MPSPSDRLVSGNQLLFNAKAATGVSPVFDCAGFSNVIVAVTGAVNSTLTFKFQGSLGASVTSQAAPDFSAAQSATNMWDYVSAYDLQDPSAVITGDTGVTLDNLTVAQNTRMYIVNVAAIRYFSLQVSAYTDGSLSAMVMGTTA